MLTWRWWSSLRTRSWAAVRMLNGTTSQVSSLPRRLLDDCRLSSSPSWHRHGTQGAAQGLFAVWSSWYRQDPHWEVYCTRSKLHLLLYLCLESDFQVGGRGGENCAGAVCSGQGPSAEWRLHLRDWQSADQPERGRGWEQPQDQVKVPAQLDGANCLGEKRVPVVGATNRPQKLNDAARRRLVRRLYIPLPDSKAKPASLQGSWAGRGTVLVMRRWGAWVRWLRDTAGRTWPTCEGKPPMDPSVSTWSSSPASGRTRWGPSTTLTSSPRWGRSRPVWVSRTSTSTSSGTRDLEPASKQPALH